MMKKRTEKNVKPYTYEIAKDLLKSLEKKPTNVNAMVVVNFVLELKDNKHGTSS